MIAIVCVTLFPFYHIALISLSNGNAVLRGEVKFLPVGFTLDSYRLVMEDPAIPRALMNSVIYTIVGTFINLVMTALCAYPLARATFSGRTLFTWMVAFTMLFSGGLIPLYLLVMQLGLLNSIWAIVLPTAINPWFMFILRTSFKQVDESIYEAALIDGANDLQILWQIAVPLAKPTMATLLLFYAVAHWNEFFYPMIFLDDRTKYPIQLIMRNIVLLGRAEQTHELGGATDFAVIEQTLKYATIMVSTLPILAVYPFVQKYFVRGVMVGAIKG
jgi:putative aldouronate transport system permease protein